MTQETNEIEVTEEMIEAGVEKLRTEGWMEVWADGLDHSLVRSIYQAMEGQKVRISHLRETT